MLKVNFVPLVVKMLSRQRRHRQDSVQTKPLFTLPTRSLQNMQLKSSFNLAAYQNNQLYMWLVFGLDPDSIKLAASFFSHTTQDGCGPTTETQSTTMMEKGQWVVHGVQHSANTTYITKKSLTRTRLSYLPRDWPDRGVNHLGTFDIGMGTP